MTITNDVILNAYMPLKELYKQRLRAATSRKLYDMIRAIQPTIDFQIEQEQQFLEQHPPKGQENGAYVFNSAEEANAFRTRISELTSLETELNVDKLVIDTSKEPDFEISGEDIEKISPLVDIVDHVDEKNDLEIQQ